jgi:bacillopeptidase F (M6 metalloprotease family)
MKLNIFNAIKGILYMGILTGMVNFSFAQNQTIVWHEDWEGDWSEDWVVTAGTWEIGLPSSGPDSAYAGQNCAATILDGNYDPQVQSRLEMADEFVVPDADECPRLRFWHWYDIAGSDLGEVQIKIGPAGSWERLSDVYNRNGGGVWSSPMIDLKAYAGKSVKIGFEFSSDGDSSSISSGWYIDEISLITGEPQLNNLETWEGGLGDWYTTRGTWEIGEPTSGPNTAYQGQNCAATVLGGNYTPRVNSRLASPYFVIPDTSFQPRLRFAHWYDIGGSDYGECQLRVKGKEWQPLLGPYVNTSGGIWFSPFIDLSQFIGDTVQVCFFFRSDGGGSVKSGWYIDNIDISFYNVTGIDDQTPQEGLINSFVLHQNHPNPFNPATTIRYYLPTAAAVEVTVYNLLGMEIKKLIEERQFAGTHSVVWDGRDRHGNEAPSGVYLYQLKSEKFTQTNKMILLR